MSTDVVTSDEQAMRRALMLAARGPIADPNPRVGAVVLDRAGRVVGEGWHEGAGTPHAEAVALAEAGGRAAGGTCYVTLEPCDHVGRTPACSRALLTAGVGRVVVARTDPNPVAAGGLRRLAEAGVAVTAGVLVGEADALNREWLHAMRIGRPFVTWKVAGTLDGRTAAADATSRWITGPQARRDVHALRAQVGAILVGTGTALADDPALTVRGVEMLPRTHPPLRVVMGERASQIPAAARVRDDSSETLLLTTHDPHEALAALHTRGIRHVLLEGGATLAAAYWRAGVVDEVVAYVAPMLLGAGPSLVGDLGVTTMADALRLDVADVTVLGADVRITARTIGEV